MSESQQLDRIRSRSSDLSGLRVPYHSDDDSGSEFSVTDPFDLFDEWFNQARSSDAIKEPNAMVVCTADKLGKPSSRYVLLKSYGPDGFRFFTNYESRKGKEIAENPNVSLLLYWEALCRQVRIEGTASKVSREESDIYFHSRPRSSQLSASVSPQSTVISDRKEFIEKIKALDEQYADIDLPTPEHWGGYLVVPQSIEFWRGRTSRFHDRVRFRRPLVGEEPDGKTSFAGEGGWLYEHLAP